MRVLVVSAIASLAAAQATYSNGTFTCAKPGAAYCAGDSLSTDIIIRCDENGKGIPGRCEDNLAGQPPLGVNPALCWQKDKTSGIAACEKNCIVYGSSGSYDGTFTLGSDICTPYSTAPTTSPTSTSGPTTYTNGTTTKTTETTTCTDEPTPTTSPTSTSWPTGTGTYTNGTTTKTTETTTCTDEPTPTKTPEPSKTKTWTHKPTPTETETCTDEPETTKTYTHKSKTTWTGTETCTDEPETTTTKTYTHKSKTTWTGTETCTEEPTVVETTTSCTTEIPLSTGTGGTGTGTYHHHPTGGHNTTVTTITTPCSSCVATNVPPVPTTSFGHAVTTSTSYPVTVNGAVAGKVASGMFAGLGLLVAALL